MRVTIPRVSNMSPEEREDMEACFRRAASAAKITEERAVLALTGFIEEATDRAAIGKVVPFFNVFKLGAVPEQRRARLARYNQGRPYCRPRIVFGKAIRRQFKAMAPNSQTAKTALDHYARNSTRGSREIEPLNVGADMREIQRSIAEQMGED